MYIQHFHFNAVITGQRGSLFMLLLDNVLALLVILWLQVSPFLLQFLVSHLAKLHLLVTL